MNGPKYSWEGIMLLVTEDTPSELLPNENAPIEGSYIELNLGKKEMANLWLL